MANRFALIGWSLPVIESMQKAKLPYVVVSFPEFELDKDVLIHQGWKGTSDCKFY